MILRLPKDILSGRSKRPDFYLCQADKTILGGLNVINASATFKFNSYSEVNCEVYKTYPHPITGEVVENPLYNKVEALRLLYVVDFGYFQIQESTIILEGNIEYKKVVAYSLEYSLCNRYLDNFMINLGVAGSIDGVTLLNDDKTHSLLHLILEKMPDWSIGTQVDLSLQNKKRSFDVNHQSIYDFMMNDMCDTFKCIFKFDTENNEIEVYDEESYSIDTNIRVSMDTIANSAEINYSADDIKTRLYVYGADDISIREANLGLEYITNISYYCTEDWLGKELYDAYMAYSKLTESKREKYSELILEWSKIYDEYSDCYNKVPHYEESNIPIVDKQSDLPQASSKYVYDIYKVKENGSYYICKAKVVNGNTTYQWELDVDGINSFYTLPTPSIEYVSGVYKVYNNDAYDGVLYYICQSYKKDNGETGYEWVLAENKYGINLLKEKELCYKDIQEAQVSAGFAEKTSDQYDRYLENYNKLMDIQSEIKKAESEAHTLKTKLEYYNTQMNEISKELALEKNFTPEQIKNLNPFIREDQLKDDHYLVTSIDDDKTAFEVKQELLKSADKELAKISQPQLSFSMSLANILDIPAFEPLLNNFETGNNIIVEIRPDYVVKTQILEINLNFDDMSDFNVTFGNLNSLSSQTDIHSALLSQAVSAGKSVAESSSYWDKGASNASSVINRIEAGLIDANTTIKSTTNQAISWDSHGFHLRKYADESKSTYEQEEIWMNNEKIVFTDDNWRTAKMAVGKFYDSELGDCYGIIAPNLVGKMIVGDNLVIQTENVEGQPCAFRVDENGASLYNAKFEIKDENSHIVLDPDLGIGIGTGDIIKETPNGVKSWNSDNVKFWVDDSGNIQIKGNITGEITGKLNALDLVVGENQFISSGKVDGNYLDLSNYATIAATEEKINVAVNKITDTSTGVLKDYATTEWTSDQIESEVKSINDNLTTNYSTTTQTSKMIETEVGKVNDNLTTNYSTTKQTADLIQQEVGGKIGEADAKSLIQQTMDAIELSVSNGETSSTITLTSGETQITSPEIKMSGMVTFTDLSTSGKTTIHGGNINTNSITFNKLDTSTQSTINSKSTTYTSKPSSQKKGDLLIPSEDIRIATGRTFTAKKIYKCSTSSASFNPSNWVEITQASDASLYNFLTEKYINSAYNFLQKVNEQADKKAEIWYQSNTPKAEWLTNGTGSEHIGDIWCEINKMASIFTSSNGSSVNVGSVPSSLYDAVDGKSSIYIYQPNRQEENDFLIPYSTFTADLVFSQNKVYRCTKDSNTFNSDDWIEVKYTDDTKANESFNLANYAQQIGQELSTGIGFTTINGQYVISPHIVGGQLSISDGKGISAVIEPSGKLTCTGADITGKITATEGEFHGTIGVGQNDDGSYNFVVESDGSVVMNGGITLGGTIEWSADSSPMRTLYAVKEENKPTKHYDKYNDSSDSTWHKVCSEDDLYVSYSYDGGNTWTIAQPIAKVPDYIKSTYIDFSSVNAPFLRGNNISMFDGRFKVFKTEAGMLWDGTKEEIENESTELGFIGYGKGNNSLADTEGVVLSSVGASDYACGANYVIVTDSGVRMQSGWHSLYVTSTGCYQSVYDPESMEENPVRIGVCVFAE